VRQVLIVISIYSHELMIQGMCQPEEGISLLVPSLSVRLFTPLKKNWRQESIRL
jgi:hypothetical protein